MTPRSRDAELAFNVQEGWLPVPLRRRRERTRSRRGGAYDAPFRPRPRPRGTVGQLRTSGLGTHHGPGTALARLEARVALQQIPVHLP
ncbi:hypothetical protein E0504_46050 [Parafrankia sp. BMG5.11]|nr:hypothetical protein E0504_46050 [Parafrankia sp. BMG5.11]